MIIYHVILEHFRINSSFSTSFVATFVCMNEFINRRVSRRLLIDNVHFHITRLLRRVEVLHMGTEVEFRARPIETMLAHEATVTVFLCNVIHQLLVGREGSQAITTSVFGIRSVGVTHETLLV